MSTCVSGSCRANARWRDRGTCPSGETGDSAALRKFVRDPGCPRQKRLEARADRPSVQRRHNPVLRPSTSVAACAAAWRPGGPHDALEGTALDALNEVFGAARQRSVRLGRHGRCRVEPRNLRSAVRQARRGEQRREASQRSGGPCLGRIGASRELLNGSTRPRPSNGSGPWAVPAAANRI